MQEINKRFHVNPVIFHLHSHFLQYTKLRDHDLTSTAHSRTKSWRPSSLKQLSECQFFSTMSLSGYSKTLRGQNHLCIGVGIFIKYLVQKFQSYMDMTLFLLDKTGTNIVDFQWREKADDNIPYHSKSK